MRLTREDNPESLRRYGHLRPTRGGLAKPCYQVCPGTSRSCALEQGHRGPHAAFGPFGRILAVWDGAGAAVAKTRTNQKGLRRPKKPIGLRAKRPESPLQAVRDFMHLAFGSAEELAWAIFFIVFVGFAIGGFLLIYLG